MSIPINCKGCVHHRPLGRSYSAGQRCCHHLLDTGHRRKQEGDICLSRSTTRTPKADPFAVPAPQR